MCLIVPITNALCSTGRAGINMLWVTACANVLEFTFDPLTSEILTITMDVTQPDPVFVPISFEKGTGFFNQEITKNKNAKNVAQTISFVEPNQNAPLRFSIESLEDCCCYISIVRDNNGKYHVAGITYFPATDTWQTEDMVTGAGSSNTGANPTSDSNENIITLVANTGSRALFLADGVVIPV